MEGDQQRKKLPSSLLWFFSFFQIQKSPIIYLSLSFSFLCIYLYPQAQSPTYSIYFLKKGEKVSNPPCVVPYRISSISKCSRTRQKKKKKKKICLFFSSSSCGVVASCAGVCVCTGVVNGYHHLGFYLAFHSRSVWPSSDRSDGRNPHTL
jgi:hypothetical protein